MSDREMDLIEQLGKAFDEFKKANDDRLKQIESKGSADVVTSEKVDKINAEVGRIEKELKTEREARIELEKKASRPRNGSDGEPVNPEHKNAFMRYVKGHALTDAERKALMSSSDPDGGYTVHPELDSMIDRVARTTIAMRQVATVRTIGTRSYKKLVTTSGASVGG